MEWGLGKYPLILPLQVFLGSFIYFPQLLMSRSSRILQVILGIFLGTFLVASVVGAFGYFLWTKFAISPSRPTFVEERKPKKIAKAIKKSSPSVTASASPSVTASASPSVTTSASPSVTASASPSPEATKSPDELPKGAYKARVQRAEGLSLRSGPSRENERIGSVSHNERVIVLEKTEDGEWSKIRSTASDAQGWVRSGNLSSTEEEAPQDTPSP